MGAWGGDAAWGMLVDVDVEVGGRKSRGVAEEAGAVFESGWRAFRGRTRTPLGCRGAWEWAWHSGGHDGLGSGRHQARRTSWMWFLRADRQEHSHGLQALSTQSSFRAFACSSFPEHRGTSGVDTSPWASFPGEPLEGPSCDWGLHGGSRGIAEPLPGGAGRCEPHLGLPRRTCNVVPGAPAPSQWPMPTW